MNSLPAFRNHEDILTSYIWSLTPQGSDYSVRVLNPFDVPHEIRELYKTKYGAGKFVYDMFYSDDQYFNVDSALRYVTDTGKQLFWDDINDDAEVKYPDIASDIADYISNREKGRIMHNLASYISDYVNEERTRNPSFEVTPTLIFNAIEAYEGGAR